ncbi:MAG: hypothetical protein F6K36_01260 [Symploca sp. SIO3C6]|uniref:Uncharacterized protein n=1 Tax=Symploca sp. SIO1C4 TaxID=2607765 RepID=A0A6B3NB80_9CYAN|nr:hypothetical protein [Symploca sp. SIO3C6]NER28937.1 hypothetical protein [Symploca sp. SIO1C4]NET06690.1 hypothetical protein [Symploca sp. SIO2B6]NET53498.1 hypothetical protein [Merismopedia sp. SIO2A8]
MTTLFTRLQPSENFHISVGEIAQFLNIPEQEIVRVEFWKYIVFVHRRDVGGQFISYRKLRQWLIAIAHQIQKCSSLLELLNCLTQISEDFQKHEKQYNSQHHQFLSHIWFQRWETIISQTNQTHQTR